MKPASHFLLSILFLRSSPSVFCTPLPNPQDSTQTGAVSVTKSIGNLDSLSFASRFGSLSFLARDRSGPRIINDGGADVPNSASSLTSTPSDKRTRWWFFRGWRLGQDEVQIQINQDDDAARTAPKNLETIDLRTQAMARMSKASDSGPRLSPATHDGGHWNIEDTTPIQPSAPSLSAPPNYSPWDMIRCLDFGSLLTWVAATSTGRTILIVVALIFLFFFSFLALEAAEFVWKFVVAVRFLLLLHRKIRSSGEQTIPSPAWRGENWEGEEEAEEEENSASEPTAAG